MQIIKSPHNMVKKCSLFLLGLLTMISVATGQVTVNIGEGATDAGGTVDLDVSFDNFDGIISAQFSIDWDTDMFEFNSIQNITTSLDQFTGGSISEPSESGDAGVVQVSWSKTNTQPETLANGTRVFTIRLTAIGDPCDVSPVRLSNSPTVIEFADVDANNVGGTANNGSASINGTNCSGGDGDLIITIDDVTVDANSNRCVPVRVENFVNIQTVEFSFTFDPTIARYTGFQNANMPDFSGGNMNELNANSGEVKLAWFDNTAVTPLSLEGVLIEFCFDAVGTDGQVSALSLDEAEFTNADEDVVPFILNEGSFTMTGDVDPSAFTLIAADASIGMGAVECVPITVRNFTNIQTMQFVLRWDPDALIFSEVRNLNLDQLTDDNITLNDDDRIRVSWNNPQSASVANETAIFELCLEARGDCDNISTLSFASDPFFEIEVSNSANQVVDVSTIAGNISIDCDGCAIAIQSLENPSCPGDSDGSIIVNLGSPGVTYTCTWKDVDGNVIQEGTDCNLLEVEAGTYTLEIDDGADCQESRTFTLEGPENIAFGGSKMNEDEGCDGSINIEMIGGTGSFEFLWDDGSTSAIRTMLCAGEYCVTATDENDCTAETCFTVQEGGPMLCEDADVTDVRCNGDDDGAINICIEGGTGPYTVMWSGPSGTFNTEDISGLLAGTYNYTITDSSSPTISSNGAVVVEEPDMISASAMTTPSTGSDGAIDLSVSGGTPNYTYVWSPGGQTTEDISGLASQTYTVTIMDENNCSQSFDFFVESDNIQVILDNPDASCNNVCDGSISGTVEGGTAPYTFTLDGAVVTFPINDLCAGEYMFVVTDSEGDSQPQTVVIDNPEVLTVVTENVVICTNGEDNGSISVEVSGGTEEYTYNWSSTGGDTPRVTDLGPGEYNVVVTDARGCTATLDQPVEIDCRNTTCFTSRSVITPNGDDLNNEFIIMCATGFTNKLFIFDRWGRTVYEVEDYDNTWEGTDQSGEELPDGGYLWVLEITNGDGSRELKKGTVTILRDQF